MPYRNALVASLALLALPGQAAIGEGLSMDMVSRWDALYSACEAKLPALRGRRDATYLYLLTDSGRVHPEVRTHLDTLRQGKAYRIRYDAALASITQPSQDSCTSLKRFVEEARSRP